MGLHLGGGGGGTLLFGWKRAPFREGKREEIPVLPLLPPPPLYQTLIQYAGDITGMSLFLVSILSWATLNLFIFFNVFPPM